MNASPRPDPRSGARRPPGSGSGSGPGPGPERGPEILVSLGGGGVGKTTTSAALALGLARRGGRTLVVTIDPARRLADALQTRVGSQVMPLRLPGAGDRLFALMPEPREAMRQFTEYLCAEQPEALDRLLRNRLYQVLEEAVPGIHELVCMSLVTRAAEELALDSIVIDTAPSRYAIDFVTYPRRLGKLLGNRAVAWLSSLGPQPDRPAPGGMRWLAWGRRRAENALASVLGPNAVSDVAELFSAMSMVRERFVDLSRRASSLLLSKETRYLLVTAPTGASTENALYLHRRLRKLKLRPVALLINQALDLPPPWQPLLEQGDLLAPALADVLHLLEAERDQRARAADRARAELRQHLGRLEQICLPHVHTSQPREVVLALADTLEAHLATLTRR